MPMSGMLGVFIGGVLALLGSWLGPWFSERRREAAKRRRRRIQKYEELVGAIFEFDSWVDMLRRNQAWGDNLPSAGVSPFAKVLAIADVYFPECCGQVYALGQAAEEYRHWVVKAHVACRAGGATPTSHLLNSLRRQSHITLHVIVSLTISGGMPRASVSFDHRRREPGLRSTAKLLIKG
jgi:hypothetical protein